MDYELPKPSGYSLLQIVLHWIIGALVAAQLIFGEGMEEAAEAFEENRPLSGDDVFAANMHLLFGILILLLALVRLAIRLGRGAPPAPEGTPRLQVLVIAVVHWAFYALLIAVPVVGLLAWFVAPQLGELHALAKPAFVVLILVHLAGAAWHQFFGKDPVVHRMFMPVK